MTEPTHTLADELHEHLTATHGAALLADQRQHEADPDGFYPWIPCASGWSEQLDLDGRPDLAEHWDGLSADAQLQFLRDALDSWHEGVADAGAAAKEAGL